ncbi:MAG: amylo-alpha-1,6-glucosidase [Terriglobales bacterium]
MEDVIQIENQFYVLATSSLADDRTRVLKWGETFGVFNRLGDIESIGLGEQGLYHNGTRHLSRLALRMGEKVPQLLRSTIQDDNAFLTLDMMNPDIYDGNILLPRGSVHLFRAKFLWQDVCYDRLRLANFCTYPVETSVSLEFAADFADIFQVRGVRRERTGEILPAVVKNDCVVLSYRGLDGLLRCTRLQFNPPPDRITQNSVRFMVSLAPRDETVISMVTSCEETASNRASVDFGQAMSDALSRLEEDRRRFCRIATSNSRFNAWLSRSEADVHMMISGNPEGAYPYAGVPWFSTVFGRDGILTAMECLWVAPWIGKGVLRYLADTQATSVIPEQEAEPGKIVHEIRHGEMANLQEIPFGKYYGSVDATPLFVMLAASYCDISGDLPLVREIWPNILAAIDWIDTYGDADKDGFVEYRGKAERGLTQQGWKDSHDSVFHRDGSLASPPIALCEVQGYVYGAKKAAARIAKQFGLTDLARKLDGEAASLKERFAKEFWDEELGTYVLALDGEKKACRVRSSNAGHCLWSRIASEKHASQQAETLLCEDLFCGWGIRTIGSGEVRYNPMSYHNGSVWPHDNAIIACGLARCGRKQEALRILGGLFEASTFMELNRLPELFCGFHKRSPLEAPTLYPVACSPQAWAAGSVYLLLESCLGISVRSAEHKVEFASPRLPKAIEWIEIKNLRVGRHPVDIRLGRNGDDVSLDVLSNDDNVKVRVRK